MAVEGLVEMCWVVGAGELELASEGCRGLAAALSASCPWENVSVSLSRETGLVLDLTRGPARVEGRLRRSHTPLGTLTLRHLPARSLEQFAPGDPCRPANTKPTPSEDMFFPSWLDHVRQSSSFYSVRDEKEMSLWGRSFTVCDFGLERLPCEEHEVVSSERSSQHPYSQYCLHNKYSTSRSALSKKINVSNSVPPFLFDYVNDNFDECATVENELNLHDSTNPYHKMDPYQRIFRTKETGQVVREKNANQFCHSSPIMSDNFYQSGCGNYELSVEEQVSNFNAFAENSKPREQLAREFTSKSFDHRIIEDETVDNYDEYENNQLPPPGASSPNNYHAEDRAVKEESSAYSWGDKEATKKDIVVPEEVTVNSKETFSQTELSSGKDVIKRNLEGYSKNSLFNFAINSLGKLKRPSNGNKKNKHSSVNNVMKTDSEIIDVKEKKPKHFVEVGKVSIQKNKSSLEEEKSGGNAAQINEIVYAKKKKESRQDDDKRVDSDEFLAKKAVKKLLKHERHLIREERKRLKLSNGEKEEQDMGCEDVPTKSILKECTINLSKQSAFVLEETKQLKKHKRRDKKKDQRLSKSSSSILLCRIDAGSKEERRTSKRKEKGDKVPIISSPLLPDHPKELQQSRSREPTAADHNRASRKKGKHSAHK